MFKIRSFFSTDEISVLQEAIKYFPGYAYLKNTESKYIGCNTNLSELAGLKNADEIIGKIDEELPWSNRAPFDFAKIDLEIINTGIKNVSIYKLPHEKNRKNYLYIKMEKVAIKDKKGKIKGIFAMGIDITEEKLIEQQLMKQKQDNIIANMPGYIFWKNKNSEYMGCNNNLAKISNLKDRSEIVGKTDYEFEWGKEQAAEFIRDDQEVMQKKHNKITEYRMPIKRGDGNYYYIRTEKMPLYDNGEVVGVLAVAIDVTDEKLALKETHIAHTFVEDILDNLPGLIYWKNKDSQYMGFNKNVLTLSGLSRDQLVGKTDQELNWGQKEAESFQRDDQEVIETGQKKVTEHQIPVKRFDGNFIILKTEKSRLYNRQGEVVGVLGVAMDITDQKILENQLKEQRDKAEIANQIKMQFIENMEHDIRTPFNGIYGMANRLWQKETEVKKKEWLGDITQCAKELLDYCNDILDFSKIQFHDYPILERKFNLHDLLSSVVKTETPPAKIKNLSLKSYYDKNLPEFLLGDNYRLYRVLINLVSNAIKFTDKGEVSVEFKLLKKEQKRIILRFTVNDTGIGIPEEKQQYIYEKFSKLSPSNKGLYKGMGTGLTVVKQFISEMEGEIEIFSKVGSGSRFICDIPFKLSLSNNYFHRE